MKRNTDSVRVKGRYYFIYAAFLVLLLSLSPCTVWAATGFGMENNQITITTSDASYTPSVSTDGVVDSVYGMTGDLESMSFTLVNDGTSPVPDGSYTADLGVIVDDVNNDRHIEAALLNVGIDVAGNDITLTISAGNSVQLVGRNYDSSIAFYTTLDNVGTDTPVVTSGASAIVNFTNLISKVEDKFGAQSGNAAILQNISSNGSYTYQVFVKSASVPIGTLSGTTVTPFTSAQDIGTTYAAAGFTDSALETLLLADLPDGTCTTAPYDDCRSPISNPTYLNGTSYILSGAYSVGAITFNLDIDGNGTADALTDGVLILRKLFGYSGSVLIENAVGVGATRDTATLIDNYFPTDLTLDVDNNGTADALTDGVLILRRLFGYSGTVLIENAIGVGAVRTTATEIETYIDSLNN